MTLTMAKHKPMLYHNGLPGSQLGARRVICDDNICNCTQKCDGWVKVYPQLKLFSFDVVDSYLDNLLSTTEQLLSVNHSCIHE